MIKIGFIRKDIETGSLSIIKLKNKIPRSSRGMTIKLWKDSKYTRIFTIQNPQTVGRREKRERGAPGCVKIEQSEIF